jgi:DNA-binding NarL/FixJ family response regulator
MEQKIKLMLVDDHVLFRQGLAALLSNYGQFEIVSQVGSGEEAVKMGQVLSPDVILMDLKMPVCNGVDATRLLREAGFSKNIVMLTVSDREEDLFDALKCGANGYILKDTEVEELVVSIIHAAKNEAVISPIMANKLLKEFNTATHKRHNAAAGDSDTLTERETEILQMVAGGATNKDIAAALFLTENTVKSHMRSIMSKLHMRRRYEVVGYAVKRGFINLVDIKDTECP